jgi:hypothetical protein
LPAGQPLFVEKLDIEKPLPKVGRIGNSRFCLELRKSLGMKTPDNQSNMFILIERRRVAL